MINEVLEFLPYLGLAISLNIALGIFKNVGEKKLDFSWKVFFVGLIKSITISYLFVVSAVIYDKLNITLEIANLELTAIQILQSAIALYLVKSLNNLKEIFQVKGDETVKK